MLLVFVPPMRVTTVDDRCWLFSRLVFDEFDFSKFSEKAAGPDAPVKVPLHEWYFVGGTWWGAFWGNKLKVVFSWHA